MRSKTTDLFTSHDWTRIVQQWQKDFPHISTDCLFSSDFIELRLKMKEDGTVLAILKKFGADGGPTVLFGVGYDPVLAIMALDKASQGGNWRVDTPWEPKAKKK